MWNNKEPIQPDGTINNRLFETNGKKAAATKMANGKNALRPTWNHLAVQEHRYNNSFSSFLWWSLQRRPKSTNIACIHAQFTNRTRKYLQSVRCGELIYSTIICCCAFPYGQCKCRSLTSECKFKIEVQATQDLRFAIGSYSIQKRNKQSTGLE